MQDISSSMCRGRVERLRFMDQSSREEVLAPIGIIRRDATLAERQHEMEQRLELIRGYKQLVSDIKERRTPAVPKQ
jgi:hypothetical protein